MVLAFLTSEGVGLDAHHDRFKTVCKLDAGSWGVQEHANITAVLKQAMQVDQIDPSNSVAVELLFRRLQTIEFSHAEKARELENKGAGGRLSSEEQQAFAGASRSTTTLLICPALLEHVRVEVEREASLAKNIRKAREEREALSKKK